MKPAFALRCGRGVKARDALCTLCHSVGLDPLAWQWLTVDELLRAVARRCAA